MLLRRDKRVHLDGSVEEYVAGASHGHLEDLKTPDDVEALGREAFELAQVWRKELAERGPPAPLPPAFEFTSPSGGCRYSIASWLPRPWALIRYGTGTVVAYVVWERPEDFEAWPVTSKPGLGARLWQCRHQRSDKIARRDLIEFFPGAADAPHQSTISSLCASARGAPGRLLAPRRTRTRGAAVRCARGQPQKRQNGRRLQAPPVRNSNSQKEAVLMKKSKVSIPHGVRGVNGDLRPRGIEHRDLTAKQRIALAAASVTGSLSLHDFTITQAAGLFRVAPSRVGEACRLSPPTPPHYTDKDLDRVVARYGAEALMRALDRHTSPPRFVFAVAAE
jgi:hypothetical protein